METVPAREAQVAETLQLQLQWWRRSWLVRLAAPAEELQWLLLVEVLVEPVGKPALGGLSQYYLQLSGQWLQSSPA
jgi:hypothetical protein